MLVPMTMAQPQKAWTYAAICTLASVVGGIVGYLIGALLYDTVGAWLIRLYGYGDKMDAFRALYQQHGHWIILIKGFTPIPFQADHHCQRPRRLRFRDVRAAVADHTRRPLFLVAGVMNRYGGPIRRFIETHLTLVGIVTVMAILGGFVVAKYLL